MKRTSGPITIEIYEGMVKVAERTYVDAHKARLSARRWPQWMTVALRRVEREAAVRNTGGGSVQ